MAEPTADPSGLSPDEYEILFGAPPSLTGVKPPSQEIEHVPTARPARVSGSTAPRWWSRKRVIVPFSVALALAVTAVIPEPDRRTEPVRVEVQGQVETSAATRTLGVDDGATRDLLADDEDIDLPTSLTGIPATEYLGAYVSAAREELANAEIETDLVPDLPFMRDAYAGDDWDDTDQDCQSDRDEVLIAKSLARVKLSEDGCRVLNGLWVDSFDGSGHTDASEVTVDRLVPLAAAHRAGAWAWDSRSKQAFARDIDFAPATEIVDANMNPTKGDRSPDQYRPPRRSTWCAYALDWIAVKTRWSLSYSIAEAAALNDMLDACEIFESDQFFEDVDTEIPLADPITTVPG